MNSLSVLKKPDEISFDALSQVVTTLGDHSKDLSADEKVSACKAIDTWENLVVKKISQKCDEMRGFINILTGGPFGYCSDKFDLIEKLKLVCLQAGLEEEFSALSDSILAENNHSVNERPDRFFRDDLMSPLEARKKQAEYDSLCAKHNLQAAKLHRKSQILWTEILGKLKKNAEYKSMLDSCKTWLAKQDSYLTGAREKADVAKMNIAISSPEVRKLLREMFDYKIEY